MSLLHGSLLSGRNERSPVMINALRHAVLPISLSMLLVLLLVAPAAAAAPSNDTIDGAISVDLGFSETRDTTEATTDEDDAALNEMCGAPATDASVWYAHSPSADGGVVVDVSESDYSAGVIVASGSPGDLALEACGPGTVGFSASTDSTYYILAFDDQFDGGGNGGELSISLEEAPPPPELDVEVDDFGTFDPHDGTATLTGTFTCSHADFLSVFGEVTQQVGRGSVDGHFSFFSSGECDGEAHKWSAEVVPEEGTKFAGGKAMTVTFSFACGSFECALGFDEHTVQLRGDSNR